MTAALRRAPSTQDGGARGEGNGASDKALKTLRPDLEMCAGTPSATGKPTWLIYDPARHRFFQIDAIARDLLALWPSCRTAADLRARADAACGIHLDDALLDHITQFIDLNELALEPAEGGWRMLWQRASRRTGNPLMQLAHGYLFFRVPLVRPQRFLQWTLPVARIFATRAFGLATVTAALLGLYLVVQQWQQFLTTAEHAFTWQGALSFAIALAVVKAVHELAHAYVAVAQGTRVPTIGVAFMLLFPLLYTDVTDTWRLRRRRDRLAVDCAGVAAELAIAAFATVLWAFLPDGPLRSVVFMLATAGWILSLAINANPFMRFDGYYILSGLVGVENLQSRAFAVSKWALREGLFGLNAPVPEPFQRSSIIWMAIYGYGVWIYRLFLFIGIAILVYVSTFKVLGVILFLFEIVFLISKPIFEELKVWWKMRADILSTARTATSAVVLAALVAACVIPWSGTVVAPAIIARGEQMALHPAVASRIETVHVKAMDRVKAGAPILTLRAPDLAHEERVLRRQLAVANLRLGRLSADSQDRSNLIVLERERRALRTKLLGLQERRAELVMVAERDGRVLALADRLEPGRWVAPDERLALLAHGGALEAVGYIAADTAPRVRAGMSGVFISDAATGPRLHVTLVDIDRSGAAAIDVPGLAAAQGGWIAVEKDDANKMRPIAAHYKVRFSLRDLSAERRALLEGRIYRGVIHINGDPESFAARVWRRLLTVLARESGA
ncbi:MAG: site-2 protease family protein [Pseudomonadota bacterium]